MDMAALEIVNFGDLDTLSEMFMENGLQHELFRKILSQNFGVPVPAYPIFDANPDNLDDWLQIHWEMHRAEDRILGLDTPFNLLDTDWNKESDFYQWVSSHAGSHEQRFAALGL